AAGDEGVDGFAEAAARAALGLGGGPCQLALVFASEANLDHVEDGLTAVRDRLRPEALVGCGAQGVVGSGRELEDGGVAVWAVSGGAVGVARRGVDIRPCVAQGARPVGREMTITAGEGNVIEELASEPALERLQRAVGELEPDEQAKAAGGLLLGIVADPNKP